MATIFDYDFSFTADTEVELPAMDLSQTRAIRMTVQLDDPGGAGSDTLNIYLCARWLDGVWEDRIAMTQLLGNGTNKEMRAVIQSDVPLTSTELIGLVAGPSPLSHLSAGSVINGPFPPNYIGDVIATVPPGPDNQPGASWKVIFDRGGAGITWSGKLTLDTIEMNPGY